VNWTAPPPGASAPAARCIWANSVPSTSPAAVRAAAETRGLGWAHWQFDGNFLLWDMDKDAFVQPVLDALIPDQATAALPARQTDPALDALINAPQETAWGAWGVQASERACAAATQRCWRMPLTQKASQPWDLGATSPVMGSVKKGDRLTVIVWARLLSDDASARAELPLMLQRRAAPYAAVISGKAVLTNQMQPLTRQGVALENQPWDSLNLAVHLGGIGQAVEISAPLVLKNARP
jgi:hypothetical protein